MHNNRGDLARFTIHNSLPHSWEILEQINVLFIGGAREPYWKQKNIFPLKFEKRICLVKTLIKI